MLKTSERHHFGSAEEQASGQQACVCAHADGGQQGECGSLFAWGFLCYARSIGHEASATRRCDSSAQKGSISNQAQSRPYFPAKMHGMKGGKQKQLPLLGVLLINQHCMWPGWPSLGEVSQFVTSRFKYLGPEATFVGIRAENSPAWVSEY